MLFELLNATSMSTRFLGNGGGKFVCVRRTTQQVTGKNKGKKRGRKEFVYANLAGGSRGVW
jgi:hypothetical protein